LSLDLPRVYDILAAMGFLEIKYINMVSPRLTRFVWKKTNNLATCRCPICGDSKRNRTKTRFYFYERKGGFYVKCHNCDYGTTLARFLEQFDRGLYDQYIMEKYRSGLEGRNEPKPDFKFEQPRFNKGSDSQHKGATDIGLPSLDSLPQDHLAVEFVRSRLIPRDKWGLLYYAEHFGDWAKTIDPEKELGDEPRLIIPIIRGGKLIGANCRALDSRQGKNIRYITLRKEQDEDRLWFGLDRLNPKEQVFVVEGPLDSLFLPNAVAMSGLGKCTNLPKELGDSPIFALDNEPRNKELVKTMNELIAMGRSVCFWPSKIVQKDINDMVLSGLAPARVCEMIKENSCKGPSAKLKMMTWKRC